LSALFVECAAEDQERCREEWNADLDSLPNTVIKLLYALTNFSSYAANRINADAFETKCDELDGLLTDLSCQYRTNVEQLRSIETKRVDSRNIQMQSLKDAISLLGASLEAREWPNENEQLSGSIQSARSSIEEFGSTLIRVINRSSDLLDARIDSVRAELDHVGSLIQAVSMKHCLATELLRKGAASRGGLAELLESITVDLKTIEDIEVVEWDDVSKMEYDKIIAAVKSACGNPNSC
jgi:hypothetical protein